MTDKVKAPQGRRWTVDMHPKKSQIINAIVTGRRSYRDIARQYGVNVSQITNYLKANLIPRIAEALEKKGEEEQEDILAHLRNLRQEAYTVLQEAKKEKNHMTILSAIDRALKTLDFQARLLGQLVEKREVTVKSDPLVEVRQAILNITAKYPDVQKEIASALAGIENDT